MPRLRPKILSKLATYHIGLDRAIYRDAAALSTPMDRDALSLEEVGGLLHHKATINRLIITIMMMPSFANGSIAALGEIYTTETMPSGIGL